MKKKKGFTLIEVVVSLVVVTLLFAMVASLVTSISNFRKKMTMFDKANYISNSFFSCATDYELHSQSQEVSLVNYFILTIHEFDSKIVSLKDYYSEDSSESQTKYLLHFDSNGNLLPFEEVDYDFLVTLFENPLVVDSTYYQKVKWNMDVLAKSNLETLVQRNTTLLLLKDEIVEVV